MKKDSKKMLKIFSKILAVFSRIGQVFMIIAIPFMVLAMAIIPFVVNHVDVDDSKITFDGIQESKITLEEREDGQVVIVDEEEVKLDEKIDTSIIKELFNNNEKAAIIGVAEVSLAFTIGYFVLIIIMLSNIIKFFKNLYKEDTPFILDNVERLMKVGKLMIAVLIVQGLSAGIVEYVFGSEVSMLSGSYSIFEILFVFVLAYVFKHGYELEQSKQVVSE